MKVRNKEHQFLGIEQLKELSHDFPNDAMLGEEVRRIIARATTNNPEGTSVYEPQIRTKDKDTESFKAEQSPGYRVFGKFPNS